MTVPNFSGPRRLTQLVGGLLLFGFTMALLVQSGLGLFPWDVFHQGLIRHLPLTMGQAVMVVGALLLLLWIPLHQKPGIGTILNVVLIGLAVDAGIAIVPAQHELPGQLALLTLGVVGNGAAGALYIGARLGTGPRDGLWVGLVERTGWSVRTVRTSVEVGVLGIGWILGGTVGLGTVAYAVAIGPLVQVFLPWVDHGAPKQPTPSAAGGEIVPAQLGYVSWLTSNPVDNLVR